MFSIIDIKHVLVYNNEHKNNRRIKVKKAAYNILPETEGALKTLGEQIKLARLRRDLSATLVAERADASPDRWGLRIIRLIRRSPGKK